MPDWLEASSSELSLHAGTLLARLTVAVFAGLLVAVICYAGHGRRKSERQMLLTTLVLLTVIVAMVTIVIGDSVSRAFGLVGALSIVRFRTVVDDTRDTAFVILAVVIGMAIGAGVMLIPAIGLPLIAVVSIALDRWRSMSGSIAPTHELQIRLPLGRDPVSIVDGALMTLGVKALMTGATTAKQGSAIDYHFQLALEHHQIAPLANQLNQTEGLQSIQIEPLK